MKINYIFFLLLFFLFANCSDQQNYKSIAIEKAQERDCKTDIELLITHEETELWASYNTFDPSLLCLFTCKNEVCIFSTEKE